MRIKPVLDTTATQTNGFTPNKVYTVIARTGRNGRSLTVLNDNGHERSILLNCPSPHLIQDNGLQGFNYHHKCVGHFDLLPDKD